MVLELLVAPYVSGKIFQRAVERRAVRGAEGCDQTCHAASLPPAGITRASARRMGL
jgi:hypothetical protein